MKIVCILPTLGKNLEWLESSMSSVFLQDTVVSGILATNQITPELKSLGLKYNFEVMKCSSSGVFKVLNEVLGKRNEDFDAFFFLGDDDLLHTGAIRHLRNTLEKKNLDIVYGKVNYIDKNGDKIFTNHAISISKYFLRVFPNLIPNPGTIIKIEVWNKLGGYDEKYRFAADLDFWIRSQKKFRIGAVKNIVASFRYHDSSLTGGNRDSSIKEAEEIRISGLNWLSINVIDFIQHLSTIFGEIWFKHLLRKKSKDKGPL